MKFSTLTCALVAAATLAVPVSLQSQTDTNAAARAIQTNAPAPHVNTAILPVPRTGSSITPLPS